jgi:hypothetical protein
VTTHPLALAMHPVDVDVVPALHDRNRVTTAFRAILAIPHILLVGTPVSFALTAGWRSSARNGVDVGAGTGALGVVAAVAALIAWFALVFGSRYPEGLQGLALFYLRWRVRAGAYLTLLRDEYPPFGDTLYGAQLVATPAMGERDRVSVAFRIVLAIPHLICVWALGIAWGITTLIAWFAILFTGSYPEPLYHFGVGVLRWSTRVEAYLLLLHDDYPPFSLDEC